jgi:hypothetical protein
MALLSGRPELKPAREGRAVRLNATLDPSDLARLLPR